MERKKGSPERKMRGIKEKKKVRMMLKIACKWGADGEIRQT